MNKREMNELSLLSGQDQEELFLAWRADPLTQLLFKWAQKERKRLWEAWESGSLSAAFETEFIVKNAGATGRCEAMKDILELTAEDLFGEDDEE